MKQILDSIYKIKSEKDLAMVIRQVYENLNDGFYENPPSVQQNDVLKALLSLADKVELFYE